MSFAPALALITLLPLGLFPQVRATPRCGSEAECRAMALEAAAAKDFETFHDLAWRAVQEGKRNDPALMLLLARAQSLSGRPLDALVMLGRLADLGVGGDIAGGDDFRRVRALPGWPDVERRLAQATQPAPDTAAAPATEPEPAVAAPTPAKKPRPPAAPAPAPAAPSTAASAEDAPAFAASEALRFEAAQLTPSGLAYDAVSRRFIVGDRRGRKLSVVDEFSHQVANLASEQSAGFGEVTALEIDARDGTLWVVSAGEGRTTLHRMQLISGRVLEAIGPPADAVGARFVDVAVAGDGSALVLDAGSRRVWRLKPGARALEAAGQLEELAPASIAPAPGGVAYVAHDTGIVRLDLDSGRVTKVTPPASGEVGAIVRMRWHRDALFGVEAAARGTHRAVRLRLGRGGRAVVGVDVLDPAVHVAAPGAIGISGGVLYYLSPAKDGALSVRRVELPG